MTSSNGSLGSQVAQSRSENGRAGLAWRLLDVSYRSGAWQLATTDALIQSVGRGEAPPTVRLYSWSEPVVILGVGEPHSDLDLDACRQRGFTLLRRASGGTAVFHDHNELSVEVIAPIGGLFTPSDILKAYERFSETIGRALSRLGVEAVAVPIQLARTQPIDQRLAAACFGSIAPYELLVDGRKLVGLSQIRRRLGAAVQAAVYLSFDPAPLASILRRSDGLSDAAWSELLAGRATGIKQILGRRIVMDRLSSELRASFLETLSGQLQPGDLTEDEEKSITQLERSKYADHAWTFRR